MATAGIAIAVALATRLVEWNEQIQEKVVENEIRCIDKPLVKFLLVRMRSDCKRYARPRRLLLVRSIQETYKLYLLNTSRP